MPIGIKKKVSIEMNISIPALGFEKEVELDYSKTCQVAREINEIHTALNKVLGMFNPDDKTPEKRSSKTKLRLLEYAKTHCSFTVVEAANAVGAAVNTTYAVLAVLLNEGKLSRTARDNGIGHLYSAVETVEVAPRLPKGKVPYVSNPERERMASS